MIESVHRYLVTKDYTKDPFIYPAANRNDGGEDNNEPNLSSITTKFAISNFSVRETDSELAAGVRYFEVTKSGDRQLSVYRGLCSLAGRFVKIPVNMTIDLDESVLLKGKYYIVLELILDGSQLVRGDGIEVIGYNAGKLVCNGLNMTIHDNESYSSLTESRKFRSLMLASFELDASGNIDESSIIRNPAINSFIDADSIIDKSGTTLKEWINNRLNQEIDKINDRINRLDTLTHYDEDTPVSRVRITYQDGVPQLIMYSIVNGEETNPYNITNVLKTVDDRTQVIDSNRYINDQGELVQQSSSNNGSTGSSRYIARCDHSHDRRYLLTETSGISNLATQDINSKVNFKSNIVISTDPYSESSNKIQLDPEDGSIVSSGTITGSKVYNAVWNDYADAVLREDPMEDIEPGDLVCKSKDTTGYTKSSCSNKDLVVGVVSDTYGILLGGDKGKSEKDNLLKYIPVAVSGNVKVKVIGTANPGDFVEVSDVPGVGRAVHPGNHTPGTVVGKLLEGKYEFEVKRLLMQVSLM